MRKRKLYLQANKEVAEQLFQNRNTERTDETALSLCAWHAAAQSNTKPQLTHTVQEQSVKKRFPSYVFKKRHGTGENSDWGLKKWLNLNNNYNAMQNVYDKSFK